MQVPKYNSTGIRCVWGGGRKPEAPPYAGPVSAYAEAGQLPGRRASGGARCHTPLAHLPALPPAFLPSASDSIARAQCHMDCPALLGKGVQVSVELLHFGQQQQWPFSATHCLVPFEKERVGGPASRGRQEGDRENTSGEVWWWAEEVGEGWVPRTWNQVYDTTHPMHTLLNQSENCHGEQGQQVNWEAVLVCQKNQRAPDPEETRHCDNSKCAWNRPGKQESRAWPNPLGGGKKMRGLWQRNDCQRAGREGLRLPPPMMACLGFEALLGKNPLHQR